MLLPDTELPSGPLSSPGPLGRSLTPPGLHVGHLLGSSCKEGTVCVKKHRTFQEAWRGQGHVSGCGAGAGRERFLSPGGRSEPQTKAWQPQEIGWGRGAVFLTFFLR